MNVEILSRAKDPKEFTICFADGDLSIVHLLNVFPEVNKELLLVRDNNVRARICLTTSPHHPGVGFFGFVQYDIKDKELLKSLLERADEWFKSQGVKKIIGPINLNVWFGNRFKETKSPLQFSWEPNNPPEYLTDFLSLGYEKDQGYISKVYHDFTKIIERTKPGYDRAIEMGMVFKPIDIKTKETIDILYDLNIRSFCINYMYEPISREQYEQTHIAAILNQDLSHSYLVDDKEGKTVGYAYAFVDQNLLVLKSLLVDPRAQGAQVSSALVHKVFFEGRAQGINQGVGAMIRKGNISERFFDTLGEAAQTHEYSLVSKEL